MITVTSIPKVSVVITRKDLWDNFVMSWKDIVWDEYIGTDLLDEVAKVLLSGDDLNINDLRKLFRQGNTFMLMGDMMNVLDTGTEMHREIIVDDDGKQFIIKHEDISF